MRTSSYNIYVKLQDSDDYYFMAHGYTGAIDLLCRQSFEYLKSGNFGKLSSQTFESLIDRGYITEKTKEVEYKFVQTLANNLLMHNNKKKTKSFMFIVTSNCNFRCSYCFENVYSNKGENWAQKTFNKNMIDKAYAAMLEMEPDRNKHSDFIYLYGGEPFLKENYEIVKYILKEGQKRKYRFQAITNGYDLDHFLDLLGENQIEHIQITVDGVGKVHNIRRKHHANKDSFEKIIKNISLALSTGVKISVRINIDKTNFEQVKELTGFFEDKGWYNYKNFRSYTATTYRNCTSLDESEQSFSKAEFTEKLISLRENNENISPKIGDIFDVESFLNNAIKKDNYLNLKYSYCGAHKGMRLLDPEGKIYSCWETIGNNVHEIGNYINGISMYENEQKWDNRLVTNIYKCKECKYALICGGGCAGKLASSNKNIYDSNCDDFKTVFSKMANYYFKKELTQLI